MKDIKNHRMKTLKKVIRDARRNPDVAQYIDNQEVTKERERTQDELMQTEEMRVPSRMRR